MKKYSNEQRDREIWQGEKDVKRENMKDAGP